MSTPARSWGQTLAMMAQRQVFILLLLGFSAGLPILLIFSSLSLWLKDAEVSRQTITFFSWAALGYSFKFVWAPLVDQLPIPVLTEKLGRRRSWLLASQLAIIAAMLTMAFSEPSQMLWVTAVGAVLLGFSSATQDIVIDAYRIECADEDLQPMLSSTYIAGYRIGMLVAGAGALYIAGWIGTDEGYSPIAWTVAYGCMAIAMLVGVATSLAISEPQNTQTNPAFANPRDNLHFVGCFVLCVLAFIGAFISLAPLAAQITELLLGSLGKALASTLSEPLRLAGSALVAAIAGKVLAALGWVPMQMLVSGYIAPVKDFFARYGRSAIIILLLIASYRVADIVMGVLANLFYDDLGFSKQEIASITKVYGLMATLAGGFLGGALALKFGVLRVLLLGAILSAATNILFAWLAGIDAQVTHLMLAISADNLSAGIATAAFVAYLSSLTNISFTAMQYAIFSSLMTLFPKILAGYSGAISQSLGYQDFFILTALLGIPAVLLVSLLGRLIPSQQGQKASA